MTKLYAILLSTTLLLAQSLEVDGDLTVTGSIESQTIDSLHVVIAGLEAQIAALQTSEGWETRMFEYEFTFVLWTEINATINEVTGYDLDYALFRIVEIVNYDDIDNDFYIRFYSQNADGNTYFNKNNWLRKEADNLYIEAPEGPLIFTPEYLNLTWVLEESELIGFPLTVKILITADFPD